MSRQPSIHLNGDPIMSIEGDYRICRYCKISENEEDFMKGKPICLPCRRQYKKKRRQLNHQKIIDQQRNFRHQRPERTMLRSAKSTARIKNIPFDLELSDIVIPLYCPVFGTPIVLRKNFKGSGVNWDCPSIDRINNRKGYIKGNIVVCSFLANNLKGRMSYKQIKAWYKFLKVHYGKAA